MIDVAAYAEEKIGVTYQTQGHAGPQAVCRCPKCGREKKLWINTKTGLWTCYQCQDGGGIVALVARTEGVTFGEAQRIVAELADRATRAGVKAALAKIRTQTDRRVIRRRSAEDRIAEVALPEEFVPVWDPAANLWRVPKYLTDRGVQPHTAASFGLGFCLTGRYARRIVLPCRVLGRVRYWQARAWFDTPLRYLGPAEKAGAAFFGFDEAAGAREVVVCEGPFDALILAQRGIPSIALMGKSISDGQVALILRGGFTSITVMLDGSAGSEAAGIGLRLRSVLPVRVAKLPPDQDPASAPERIVREAIRSAAAPKRSDRLTRRRIGS